MVTSAMYYSTKHCYYTHDTKEVFEFHCVVMFTLCFDVCSITEPVEGASMEMLADIGTLMKIMY